MSVRKVCAAALVGTSIEYYDYAIFAYMAVVISPLFFPSSNETASLLAGLAAFGVSFVARPVGGVVFGRWGDQLGRKKILVVTVLTMGFATAAIGLLPTYASIGIAAPGALIACRLIQGFSAGGEIGGASSYVAESARPGRRGVMSTATSVGVGLGFVLAGAVAGVTISLASEDAVSAWAWRIPFLLAAPMAIFCVVVRSRLEESPDFQELLKKDETTRAPLREAVQTEGRAVTRVAMIATAQNAGTYITLSYLSIYLTTVLDFAADRALWLVVGLIAVAVAAQPAVGALSDRVGRLGLLRLALVGYLVLPYPAFIVMSQGGVGMAALGIAILLLPFVLIQAVSLAVFTEMLGLRVRYTGVSLGFNVGAIVGGATTPYLATALVAWSGSPLAPAFVVMGASVIGLLGVIGARETAHAGLRG